MNLVLFCVVFILIFFLTFSGYPLLYLTDLLPKGFFAVFRVAFGTLLLFRLYKSIPALNMLHGRLNPPHLLFTLKAIFSVLLILGVFTEIMAVLIFLIFVVIFYKSKYFSIEEIYFQNTLFHLPFLGMGEVWSIDEMIQIPSFIHSDYMINSFFVSNGIIMLSAGYEKLKSGIWRTGKAAKLFLSLPHLVKSHFHFISKFKPSIIWSIMTYTIMFAEFFFLFSFLQPYAFVVLCFLLLCFSLTLFSVVDISFIGQILFLNLLFFLVIILMNIDQYPMLPSILSLHLNPFSILGFSVNFISLLTIFFFDKGWGISKLSKFLCGIVSPIGVFNERHLFGFYTYKLIYRDSKSETLVLKAFCDQGFPSKYQILYPRYFQSAMYPLTDYCLSLRKYGNETKNQLDKIIDLMYSGLNSINKTKGIVELFVKKFDEHDTIESYQKSEWVSIIKCDFKEVNNFELKFINMPPKMNSTFRIV